MKPSSENKSAKEKSRNKVLLSLKESVRGSGSPSDHQHTLLSRSASSGSEPQEIISGHDVQPGHHGRCEGAFSLLVLLPPSSRGDVCLSTAT